MPNRLLPRAVLGAALLMPALAVAQPVIAAPDHAAEAPAAPIAATALPPQGVPVYRRPFYGFRLPAYWTAPRFYVANYPQYGLAAPPAGYRWVRYFDQAVLVDGDNRVYAAMQGVGWHDPGAPEPDAAGVTYAEDAPGVPYDPAYPAAEPSVTAADPYAGYRDYAARVEHCRRESGIGGAAIGAVAGGVAGNRIAGRGNRTAGTLVGAGVGALAGAAIDRAEDRAECAALLHRAGLYPDPAGGEYRPAPQGYYWYYPEPVTTTTTIPADCATSAAGVTYESAPAQGTTVKRVPVNRVVRPPRP